MRSSLMLRFRSCELRWSSRAFKSRTSRLDGMFTKSSTCSTLRSNDCLLDMKRSPARPKLERILSLERSSLKKLVMPSSLIWRSLLIRLSSSLSRRAIAFNYHIGLRAAQTADHDRRSDIGFLAAQTDDHDRHPAQHHLGFRPDWISGAARESDRDLNRDRSFLGATDRDYRIAPRTL